MKKDPFVIGILVMTLLLMTPLLASQIKKYNKPAAVVKEHRLNPIVRLVKENRTYCSGFVIDETTAITAGHCVIIDTPFGGMLSPDLIDIRSVDGKDLGVRAKVKSVVWQLDRAILKGDFRKFAPMKYIDKTSDAVKIRVPGTEFRSCGYPMGGSFYCGKTVYEGDFGFLLKVKGVIIPGMSGGPTMLLDGTAVGLNDAVEYDFGLISPLYEIDMNK